MIRTDRSVTVPFGKGFSAVFANCLLRGAKAALSNSRSVVGTFFSPVHLAELSFFYQAAMDPRFLIFSGRAVELI